MDGVPFEFLVPIAPLLVGSYYVFVADASTRSKAIVALVLVLSLATVLVVPAYWLGCLLLQTAVGIYVVLYLAWTRQR